MDKMILDKLMTKKENEPLDENYKNSKMSMLLALKQEMARLMGNDLKGQGMKKVVVAGNTPDAVAEGLDKAKDIVSQQGDEDEEGDDMPGADPTSSTDDLDEEKSELDNMSDEELKELQAAIEEKLAKKSQMSL